MAWVSHLYGDLDETLVESRGFELVDSDTELFLEEGDAAPHPDSRASDGDVSDLTRESWEVSNIVNIPFFFLLIKFYMLSFTNQLAAGLCSSLLAIY